MSEIEVAYRLCKAPIIAVTGTNGKTTTTTLIGEMFRKAGFKTAVGGNIGDALSREVRDLLPGNIAVAEISSFQLEGGIGVQAAHCCNTEYYAGSYRPSPDVGKLSGNQRENFCPGRLQRIF